MVTTSFKSIGDFCIDFLFTALNLNAGNSLIDLNLALVTVEWYNPVIQSSRLKLLNYSTRGRVFSLLTEV